MLRLTLLLCFGMFAALVTLGEDRGQLRPGLAQAKAEGRLDEVWALARAKAERVPVRVERPAPEPLVTAAALPPPPAEPSPTLAAKTLAGPVPASTILASTILASVAQPITPVVEVEPGREVIAVLQEPVFTLSAFGTEPVPGADGAPLEAAPAADAAAEGTIWYVTASSVNVRAGPSTDTAVVGKLESGEAALLVSAINGEWGQIVIQGDGVEGYVALRFLSAEAP